MKRDRANLIEKLNEDLAHEYAAVIRYRTFASLIGRPHRLTLRPLFTEEIADELAHAGLLADVIAALGGTPTVVPAPVTLSRTPNAILQSVAEAEGAALARYIERRHQAADASEPALASVLETLIEDETRHREGVRRVAAEWVESGCDAAER